MRSVLSGTKSSDVLAELASRGPAKYWERTGFFDNWQTALGQMFDSEMSISRLFNYTLPKRDRDLQLEKYIDEGKLPLHGMSTHRRSDKARVVDYNSLAHYAKSIGLQTETDEELLERVRSDIKDRKEYAADIYRRASFGGKVGQLTGTFHAAAIDPVNLPGYFIGTGAAAKGASYLAKLGRVAIYGGGVNAAIQAGIEIPFSLRWKHELHMDYNMGDALKNIALAGGMGFAIPGAAITVGHVSRGITRLLASRSIKQMLKDDLAAQEAERLLQQIAREAEGVKRFTPEEGLHVGRSPFAPSYEARKAQLEAAFEELDRMNQGWSSYDKLRARLQAEELEGQYFDQFEGTEASAMEYWGGIEKSMQELNDTQPRLTQVVDTVPAERKLAEPELQTKALVEENEIDTAFKAIVGESDDAGFVADVAKADSELDVLTKFESCIIGAVGE